MPSSRATLAPSRRHRRPVSGHGLLFPLDAIYQRAGMASPVARRVRADRIPLPCRQLLVNEAGMTLTLERHVGGTIALRVLSSFSDGDSYFRRSMLIVQETGRPVAMCAIRLELDHFSRAVRAKILSERVPLGTILRKAGTKYESRPTDFFAVTPTQEMMAFFWMNEPRPLYGRQTQMTVPGGYIGDIVEILPLV